MGCFFADLTFLQKYKMVFWELYVGFSVFNCCSLKISGLYFGLYSKCFFLAFYFYPCLSRKMREMASGGPSGRSWPPAIESIKAKLYWSDHFGEPFKKRKWLPEGPRADLGLRPLKVLEQNCIGATILESLPKSSILESPLK